MNIYGLQILVRNVGLVSLAYSHSSRAKAAYVKAMSGTKGCAVELEDDFGGRAHVECTEIGGVVLIDESKLPEVQIQRALAQARANKLCQQRVATDPALNGSSLVPANELVLPRRN